MKFRYTFQKIVDLRENEKTQAEWLLSEAVGKMRSEEQELKRLHELRGDCSRRLHDASGRSASVAELVSMQQYLDHVDRQINRQSGRVEVSRRDVDEKKNHLRDRMMQEEIWQQAKSKAHRQFMHEALRREQLETDEIAARRRAGSAV